MIYSDTPYEFTEVGLTREEFDHLIFMGAPPIWKQYKDENKDLNFLYNLCHKPLKDVVTAIVKKVGHTEGAYSVFKMLDKMDIKAKKDDDSYESNPWFRPHMLISKGFEKEVMGELWIRNLAKHERKKDACSDGSFYLEDGGHRALVYAVRLECEEEQYDEKHPIKALHATSWDIADGILGHSCQPVKALEHNGKLQLDGKSPNVKKRTHEYENGFHVPIRRYKSFV